MNGLSKIGSECARALLIGGVAFTLSMLPATAQQIEGVQSCRVEGAIAPSQRGEIRLVGSPITGISHIPVKVSYQFDLSEITPELDEYEPIDGVAKIIQLDMVGRVDPTSYEITYYYVNAAIAGFRPVEEPSLATGRYNAVYLETNLERVSSIQVYVVDETTKAYSAKISAEIVQHPEIAGEDNWRVKLDLYGAAFVDADLRKKRPMHIWFGDFQGTGVKAPLDTSNFSVEDNEARVKEVARGLMEQAQNFQCNPFPS